MSQRVNVISLLFLLALPVLGSGSEDQQKREAFVVKTLSPLSASQNKKGDVFNVQVVQPEAYKGAIIEGEVKKAKAAGRVKGKSELLFGFNTITRNNGEKIPIDADLTSVANSQGIEGVDEEGRAIGKSSRKQDITRTAIASGIGAVIGGIAGGGSGAVKGAAIGAAIGLTIAFSTRGEDIYFAPGSVFHLEVIEKKAK